MAHGISRDPAQIVARNSCCWPDCFAPTLDQALPLCSHHVLIVAKHTRDILAGAAKDPAKVAAAGLRASPDGSVYFIRFRDLVKIGYTTNLPRRMASLPHDEVLHVEPGTMADEKRCHLAFAHLRGRGEWFRAEPDLLGFIDDLRTQAAA